MSIKIREEMTESKFSVVDKIKEKIRIFANDIAISLLRSLKPCIQLSDLICTAIYYGNLEIVKFLELEGCNLNEVPKLFKIKETNKEEYYQYKDTPYIILASSRGNLY